MQLTNKQRAELEGRIERVQQEVRQHSDLVNRYKDALEGARAQFNAAEGYLQALQALLAPPENESNAE